MPFVPGHVGVVFKDRVTLEEARTALASRGSAVDVLDIIVAAPVVIAIVKVPEGTEYEWIGRFKAMPEVADSGRCADRKPLD